jgi:hypothetical protein
MEEVPTVRSELREVADAETRGEIVQDRKVSPFLPDLLDRSEFPSESFLPGHRPRRGITADSEDIAAIKSRHAPGERVAYAPQLPENSLMGEIL